MSFDEKDKSFEVIGPQDDNDRQEIFKLINDDNPFEKPPSFVRSPKDVVNVEGS